MSFVRNQQISVVAFLLLAAILLFGTYNTYTIPNEAFSEYAQIYPEEEDYPIPTNGEQYAGQYAGDPPNPQGFQGDGMPQGGFQQMYMPPSPPDPLAYNSSFNDTMSFVGSPNYMNHAALYCGL